MSRRLRDMTTSCQTLSSSKLPTENELITDAPARESKFSWANSSARGKFFIYPISCSESFCSRKAGERGSLLAFLLSTWELRWRAMSWNGTGWSRVMLRSDLWADRSSPSWCRWKITFQRSIHIRRAQRGGRFCPSIWSGWYESTGLWWERQRRCAWCGRRLHFPWKAGEV